MVKAHLGDPTSVRLRSCKAAKIRLAHTLAKFNHHYGQDIKATVTEFMTQLAEDDSKGKYDVPPFEWSEGMEVVHA